MQYKDTFYYNIKMGTISQIQLAYRIRTRNICKSFLYWELHYHKLAWFSLKSKNPFKRTIFPTQKCISVCLDVLNTYTYYLLYLSSYTWYLYLHSTTYPIRNRNVSDICTYFSILENQKEKILKVRILAIYGCSIKEMMT